MGLRAMFKRFVEKLASFEKETPSLDAFVRAEAIDFEAFLLETENRNRYSNHYYDEFDYGLYTTIVRPSIASNESYDNVVSRRLRARIIEMKAMLSFRFQTFRNNSHCSLAYTSLLYGLCTGRISSLLRAYFTTSLSRAVA